MSRQIWTTEDDQIIKDNPDKSTNELMALLPYRTKSTILWRKSFLKQVAGTRKSKPFSPQPIITKTKPDAEPAPKPKEVFKPSYVQIESIQAKAEAAKQAQGTYNEHKPTTDQVASAVIARTNTPILADELTRLRCEVSHLEGVLEGVKLVLDRIGVKV